MPWRGLHRMGMREGYGQQTPDSTLNRQYAGCVREFWNNAHTGCILGIKKEAPRKTGRFLHFAGVGAGFLLSRTAVSFTAEDRSMYPAPVQIRATPPPGNITTRKKVSSKKIPGCISNVRPPHDACQYFSVPSFGYLFSVCGDRERSNSCV